MSGWGERGHEVRKWKRRCREEKRTPAQWGEEEGLSFDGSGGDGCPVDGCGGVENTENGDEVAADIISHRGNHADIRRKNNDIANSTRDAEIGIGIFVHHIDALASGSALLKVTGDNAFGGIIAISLAVGPIGQPVSWHAGGNSFGQHHVWDAVGLRSGDNTGGGLGEIGHKENE